MRSFLIVLLLFAFSSCSDKTKVDLIITNAKIYTVDDEFSIKQAMVITGGKILDIGESSRLTSEYTSAETIDLGGKTVLPGLIDAHAHLYNFGLKLSRVDLDGTESYAEVLQRLEDFLKKHPDTEYIIGRG